MRQPPKDLPKDYTGLMVEPHGVLENVSVCVAYRNGVRVAVLYMSPQRLRLVYEQDQAVWVEERTGPADFMRVYEKAGLQ